MAILLFLITINSSTPVFGFGPMPPQIYLHAENSTQQVNAGDTALYYVRVTPQWPAGWLNVTVGSRYVIPSRGLSVGELPQVEPLPLGVVEANYSKRIFVNASDTYILPVSVKVAASMGQSTINLTLLVASSYRTDFNYNDTYFSTINLHLYVEPKPNIQTTITVTSTTTQLSTITSILTTTVTTASTIHEHQITPLPPVTTSTATTTTTLTNTITERVSEPSTYAWAVSATLVAVVLAIVLLLQRRTK